MTQQTIPSLLLLFYEQGFFHQERNFDDVMQELNTVGSHPTPQNLNMALSRAGFLTKRGKLGQYRYIQKHSPKTIHLTKDVLPDELTNSLIKDFKTELADLKHNFGNSGTCTAFLLRKILEKLLFLAFAKNGKEAVLLDQNGKLVGLHTMIALATSNKVGGKPFLMQKTAEEIKGVKFLGDTAAHNPLANVSMKTIVPVMPYIVTAYAELAAML
ncbi:MAG: hypothetical protein ABTQ25_17315 [Nitrosomonas ureae]